MMRKRLLVAVWILLVTVPFAPAFGKGRKKKPTPVPAYHQPAISSVTGNAITVSDQNTTRTLTITQFTEITVNGQRASIADNGDLGELCDRERSRRVLVA